MKTIASVESFTGGLFAKEITDKPGASAYYKGSLIAYSNEIKEKLGIRTSNGVINETVALEMAKKGQKYFNVDLCVSFTGNAGPSTMEGKPQGLVYIAINEQVFKLQLTGNRSEVRKQAVEFAMNKIFNKK